MPTCAAVCSLFGNFAKSKAERNHHHQSDHTGPPIGPRGVRLTVLSPRKPRTHTPSFESWNSPGLSAWALKSSGPHALDLWQLERLICIQPGTQPAVWGECDPDQAGGPQAHRRTQPQLLTRFPLDGQHNTRKQKQTEHTPLFFTCAPLLPGSISHRLSSQRLSQESLKSTSFFKTAKQTRKKQ